MDSLTPQHPPASNSQGWLGSDLFRQAPGCPGRYRGACLTHSRVEAESLGGVPSSHFTWLLWVLLVLTKKQSPALFTRNVKNFLTPLKKEGAEASSPRLQQEPNCLLKPQRGPKAPRGSGELGPLPGSDKVGGGRWKSRKLPRGVDGYLGGTGRVAGDLSVQCHVSPQLLHP